MIGRALRRALRRLAGEPVAPLSFRQQLAAAIDQPVLLVSAAAFERSLESEAFPRISAHLSTPNNFPVELSTGSK